MRRRRTILLIVGIALLVAAAWLVLGRTRSVERDTRSVAGAGGVELEATLLVPQRATREDPRPAVLVAHGLGGDQGDTRRMARSLARAGFVVRTWSARGAGGSEGKVGIAAEEGEVADVSALIDELAQHPEVARDSPNDPRVAIVGTSQGGGVALLAAATDDRIDAVVPIFAWSSLLDALEPGGVLKLGWASSLFAAGAGEERSADPCGNLTQQLCDAWTESSAAGQFTPEARELLEEMSPVRVLDEIEAPTLIVQGQYDSLFDFEQATTLADGLREAHTPYRVEWVRAGHDLALDERGAKYLDAAVIRWLDRYLLDDRDEAPGPRLAIELGARRGHAHAPTVPLETTSRLLRLHPDVDVDAADRIRFANPPSGRPSAVTTLPGLGDLTRSELALQVPEGQRARFVSDPASEGLEIIGATKVSLVVAGTRPTGTLFVRLVDVSPGGQVQVPRGLVTPLRVEEVPALDSGQGARFEVRLTPVAWRLAPGHRIGIEVGSTDAGYAPDPIPAEWAVSIAEPDHALQVPVARDPTRTSDTFESGASWTTLLWTAAAVFGAAVLAAILMSVGRHRSRDRIQEPVWRKVPVRAADLAKRYRGGFQAVEDVSFRVDAGTIVGLVGPNGAGKTTVLRMLLGLVRPTQGVAHLYGQRVRPGIPMLRRTGVLVEGPGLLPHRTGRQHLHRYASATGRPGDAASVDAALATVDLLADADRRVGTWSQGMRQRLGIAQALLGEPDLVVLDEPTNGLDPAQIRHLRQIIRSIAASGRTVLVSSHLLGELERVCTHVVLIARGRVLAAGTLEEVVADHADLEDAFLAVTEGSDA
ncbi:MAG: transporter ATP-binding protein [Thermoleophilia bacterium]|nr:transporter ATP-binding protein [Thermoleophilia bacterium]